MAHLEQRNWFEKIRRNHPEWFAHVTVLEVGSLDINGTIRDLYDNPIRYVGVDVGPGPGVDVVANGENLDYPDNSFDIAVSAECFEHNPDPNTAPVTVTPTTHPTLSTGTTIATLTGQTSTTSST